MKKILGFIAGGICGALVGAGVSMLLTPASGNDLRTEAVERWEQALADARQAMDETRKELEAQFDQMKG